MLYITVVIGVCTAGLVWYLSRKNKASQLHGKTVVIIGASSGIGESLAEAFWKAGCKLILCARRVSELERVKQKLLSTTERTEDQIEVRQLDVTDGEAVRRTLSKTALDILVNNAGISYRGSISGTEVKVHRQVMEVNYFGQVEATNAVLPTLLRQGSGHIVFISSLQGRLSIPHRSAYSASKHALQAFADCLRAEVDGRGVKVTVVSPAYVQTSLSLSALHGDGSKHGVMDENQKKGMLPSELADRVLVAIDNQESEVLVCKCVYRMAVYARCLLPSVFFRLMSGRALKEARDAPDDDVARDAPDDDDDVASGGHDDGGVASGGHDDDAVKKS